MLIRDWMTPAPLTISPETPVLDALKLLKEHGFRRLPVMDGTKLLGIVTDKDLKDAIPAKATTLSVWEMSYLLSKLSVREVMAHPVMSVRTTDALEDAALKMQEHKIAGFPVIDANGLLVGILTITDVLRALVTVLGLNEGGVRVTLTMPDVPGSLELATTTIKPSNIVSVATAGKSDGQRQFVMRINGEAANTVIDRLRTAGIDVSNEQ